MLRLSAYPRGNETLKNNEKFTEKAEGAIEQARLAAFGLGHSYVGTEHLLLGILRERAGLGARILRDRGLSEHSLKDAISRANGTGEPGVPTQGLTKHAWQAIEKAASDAARLGHSYIGTEHLLLGILRQPDCGGARALAAAGLSVNDIYTDILAVFGTGSFKPRSQPPVQPKATVKRAFSISTAATSRCLPPREASTPSSAATRRYAAAFRSYRAAARTTPC